ncbi:MAG: D-glycero-beta-D-manno-heptose 1-phosphate adenylyltransferase [Planctomycetota bacterium]
MSSLLKTLENWPSPRVLVVGDFMLDELVFGDAERLTADAPVPVLQVRRRESTPGGAANVCNCLDALRCEVLAVGVVGEDDAGDTLSASLTAQGIDASGLVTDATRPTTRKQSLVGLAQHRHPQKMFRLDEESREPLPHGIRNALLERVRKRLASCDVVAIEDYNKGVLCDETCAQVIAIAREAGKPVIVDPARIPDYRRYHGATAITPNRSEAELATGMPTHLDADPAHNAALARALLTDLELDAVVLTLDRHGALLLERGGNPQPIPTRARQVYDVTGAGDMVLAALSAGIGARMPWADATRFANAGAGLTVEVFGSQAIPFERVHHAVQVEMSGLSGKTRTLEQSLIELNAHRREGKRIVFTNGCFDILHAGHLRLLRAARALGDVLVVAINSDDSVRRLKGDDRPVHNQHDRADLLGELESVSIVVVFDEDTPERALERIRPDVLVKGGDYTRDQVVGGAFVESYGGRVALVPIVEGRSTTAAISKLGT